MDSTLKKIAERNISLLYRTPSPHNTQPWILKFESANEAVLGWDEKRTLPITDSTKRDLYLCLGMFTQALETIVAQEVGKSLDINFDVVNTNHEICKIQISKKAINSKLSVEDIDKRSSNRKLFTSFDQENGTDQIAQILDATNCSYLTCDTRSIFQLLDEADLYQLEDSAASAELNLWLRAERRMKSLDGLSSISLDMKLYEARVLKMLLLRPINRIATKIGLIKLIVKTRPNLLNTNSTFIAFTTDETFSREAIFNTGRSIFTPWCLLSKKGVAVHPMSQIIDVKQTYDKLHKHLGLDEETSIIFVVRAGLSKLNTGRSRRLVE